MSDTLTEIHTIEGVDFDNPVMCHAGMEDECFYENEADYIVISGCNTCGGVERFPSCDECLRDIMDGCCTCAICGAPGTGEEVKIAEYLKPR